MTEKKKYIEWGVLTLLTASAVWYLLSLFLGIHLTDGNGYNTYALQADSWRCGRLDLGQDYPWLELAIFEGKYYCSFPPFPSYILFPFTFFFESATPDYFLMVIFNILIICFLYQLAQELKVNPQSAMLLTLFVTIGANTIFVMMKPSVWFFAQLLCFLMAVLSIYFAVRGKGGWSLFFWGASVGCRPMQVLFLPVLLVILFKSERAKNKEVSGIKLIAGR